MRRERRRSCKPGIDFCYPTEHNVRVEIRHARSATKHRVSRERSAHVVRNAQVELDHPRASASTDDRRMYLGFDATGVALEVIGVQREDGTVLVIHAMPIRAKYREHLER